MKRTLLAVKLLAAAFLVCFLCDTDSASAQEGHQHPHDPSEKLDRVNFIVSCKPRAQYYGPTQRAFEALDNDNQAALRNDLERLRAEHNQARITRRTLKANILKL